VDSPASHWISVPSGTQVPGRSRLAFTYRTVTFFGRLSHTFLLAERFVTPMCQALQPRSGKPDRFGLFPVRSPLLGEYFLFLWVLRCFSSPEPGELKHLSIQLGDAVGSQRQVSLFGHPRIGACTQLPEAYRSVPRPSSAFNAKASTVSS
jgi:hypothetical protein